MSIRSRVPAILALSILVGCGQKQEAQLATHPDLVTDSAAPTAAVAPAPSAAARSVTLPAGSVDGLAAALAAAGPGGTVIVAPGAHTESGTVAITQPVTIQGQPGAVLTSTTTPVLAPGDKLDPALYVKAAAGVVIRGLELLPSGDVGGTAILVDDAADVTVSGNTIRRYEYSILLYDAPRSLVDGNLVESSTRWQTGQLPEALGIVQISGERGRITNNDASGGLFNIWACDRDGTLQGNRAHNGLIGIILCRVPANSWSLPDGELIGAELSSQNWMARRNDASNNLSVGFLVIDGANRNLLVENSGAGNGQYDMALAGDSERFGFFTPACFMNTVRIGSAATMRVKNCGTDNSVIRGNQIDTSVETCN